MKTNEPRTEEILRKDRGNRGKKVKKNHISSTAAEDAGFSEEEKKSFLMRISKESECWIWNGTKSSDGYGSLTLNGVTFSSHRLSWIFHRGPIPKDSNGKTLCVLHNCPSGDNPSCVNPDHLWVGTQLENIQDRVRKGRTARTTGDRNGTRTHPETRPRGENHYNAKLTLDQVNSIRSRYRKYGKGGPGQVALAKEFGVTQCLIGFIVRGESWKESFKS